jgi:hypothetical protein
VVSIALSFPAYDSAKSYTTGDFVTFSGVNYESLTDQNVGNQPDTHPANWAAVSAGLAIGPNGFQSSDVGRLVRFLSDPDLWSAGATYAAGATVSYNPSGAPGAAQYWTSLASGNTGNIPGTDTTHWAVATNAAQWTWGKIVALTNMIDRALAGSVNIGSMTGGGGIAAAFDGVPSKIASASASQGAGGTTSVNLLGTTHLATISAYVGKNYSGASAQKILQVIVYPSTDLGFGAGNGTLTEQRFTGDIVVTQVSLPPTVITLNLRAKASAPASSADGTSLGSVTTGNSTAPVVILSGDQSTAWNYVWVEMVVPFDWTMNNPTDVSGSLAWSVADYVAQVSFFNPTGTGTSSGVNVEILGPPLLYTTPIRTWRLGLYSNTTGWPTVGTWHEGRLWLFGVVNNRLDASRANEPFNFAPTDQFGAVPDNAAITYLLNSPDTNPVLWAASDERGVLVGSQSAEWLVTATTQNLPLSPSNIQAHPATHYGSQNVEPRRAGGVLVFVQRAARKLLEFFPDVFSGRLTAPNLARDAKHLTASGIAEIAYQSELAPVIWARRNDGFLVGTTYKRENLMSSQGPAFNGWHRHILGSGRTVESICTGPSSGGNLDALTMVTSDGIVRHVELMTDIWEEGDPLTSAWFLDSAVTPASFSINVGLLNVTINGLWHLNGKTVTAFVAGVDAGDYTVSNGSITVPLDGTAHSANGTSPLDLGANPGQVTPSSPIVVGFTYNSAGQLLRPGPQKNSGAANGPAAGKIGRDHQLAVLLVDTCGGIYASAFDGRTTTYAPAGIAFGSFLLADKLFALQKYPDDSTIPQATLVSRVIWTPLENPYTFDEGQPCWRIARPYPATVGWFSTFHQTQDR